jgi:CRP/FNR family transcriptional regulator, cyclic AMP receptor protein
MPADEKLEHLRRVPLFAKMKSNELERLSQLTDEVEVGLDRVLAEQGTTGHEFFIVMDGRVMVLDGNTPVRTLGPGDFFGEIALIESVPRTATVRAEGIVKLLVIGHREFHSLMDEFPSVRDCVLDTLAERLRRTEES